MKILHIAPQPPRKNGIIDYAERYRELISKHTGHLIELFVLDEKITHCETNLSQLRKLYKISRKLATEIGDNRYDIIHAEIGSTCYPEFYLLFFLSFQNIPLPIVITLHDPPHLILDPIKYLGLSNATIISRVIKRVCSALFSGIMEKRVLTKSSLVFVLSEAGQKIACKRFKGHFSKFVQMMPFTYDNTSKNNRNIKKENIILSTGFWTPRRGLEVLIKALCLLRESSPNVFHKWKVCISGGVLDDSTSKKYYLLIKAIIQKGNWGDVIEINTDMPSNSFENLFFRSSLYISSDIEKGRSGVPVSANLLRAMGQGCALVVSDMPGKKELVVDGVNGFLYPPNDSGKLFQNLNVLLNSEETINAFRMNNRNICKTKYDGKSIINKFIYYYDTIVNK